MKNKFFFFSPIAGFLLPAAFVTLSAVEGFSQGACQWISPCDGEYDVNSTAIYALSPNTDGTIVLAGSTKDHCCGAANGTHRYLHLTKVNANGLLLWVKSIGDDSYDTDFIATGGANPMVATTDGGYAIACSTPIGYGSIVKVNSTGTWQWTARVAHTSPAEVFSDLVQTTDGGYIGVGRTLTSPEGMYAAKFDGAGSLLWTHYIASKGGYNSIIKTSDGGYALCGYYEAQAVPEIRSMYVCKMDASFVRQWDLALGSTTNCTGGIKSSCTANDIAQTPDGGFIIAGQRYMDVAGICSNGNMDCYAVKLTSSGGVQWTKTLGGTGNTTSACSDVAKSVALMADGSGYVFAGQTFSFSSNKPDIYLFKLNTDGTLAWHKTAGFDVGSSVYDDAWCLSRSAVGTDFYLGGKGEIAQTCFGGPLGFHFPVNNVQVGFLSEISAAGDMCCITTMTTTVTNQGIDNTSATPGLSATTRGVGSSVTANSCTAGSVCGTTPPPAAGGYCKICNSSTNDFTTFSPSPGSCDVVKTTCGTWTVTIMPVELTSFTAKCNFGSVKCEWSTVSESNNDYFSVERSEDGVTFKEIWKEKGAGTSSTPRSYKFFDNELQSLTADYYYRLKQVDYNGKSEYYGPVAADCSLLGKWKLVIQNIAFDEELKGTFLLTERSAVTISIVDLQGRIIKEERLEAQEGSNFLKIELHDVAKGLYFIKVYTREREIVKKFVKN